MGLCPPPGDLPGPIMGTGHSSAAKAIFAGSEASLRQKDHPLHSVPPPSQLSNPERNKGLICRANLLPNRVLSVKPLETCCFVLIFYVI